MSHEFHYPMLEVDLDKMRHNLAALDQRCQAQHIEVTGVVKGFTALPELVRVFDESSCQYLASSRIDHLRSMRQMGVRSPLMLIRIPMLSELEEVVKLADISLQSELEVLRALDREAERQKKRHKVILMVDLGDLREGFWDREELVTVALTVERELDHLELAGVGTNLTCYGSIRATPNKMQELIEVAERVEAAIGRRLEIISGGASSSISMVLNGTMPERINQLRLGESLMLGHFWECEMDFMYRDVFTLKTEVVECKTKPSYPIGQLTVDAFGHAPTYVDRGLRKRALVAIGRADYGDPFDLRIREEGVEVLGASSDHTILDVTDAKREIKVGDLVEFDLSYATILYLTNTKSVSLQFKDEGKLLQKK